MICRECQGAGTIRRRISDFEHVIIICPECAGTGLIEEEAGYDDESC